MSHGKAEANLASAANTFSSASRQKNFVKVSQQLIFVIANWISNNFRKKTTAYKHSYWNIIGSQIVDFFISKPVYGLDLLICSILTLQCLFEQKLFQFFRPHKQCLFCIKMQFFIDWWFNRLIVVPFRQKVNYVNKSNWLCRKCSIYAIWTRFQDFSK